MDKPSSSDIKAALTTSATAKPIMTPVVQAPKPEPAVKNPAPENIWLFHKDHEPRLFEKGEEVPEGWQKENKWHWYRDLSMNFQWRKK